MRWLVSEVSVGTVVCSVGVEVGAGVAPGALRSVVSDAWNATLIEFTFTPKLVGMAVVIVFPGSIWTMSVCLSLELLVQVPRHPKSPPSQVYPLKNG